MGWFANSFFFSSRPQRCQGAEQRGVLRVQPDALEDLLPLCRVSGLTRSKTCFDYVDAEDGRKCVWLASRFKLARTSGGRLRCEALHSTGMELLQLNAGTPHPRDASHAIGGEQPSRCAPPDARGAGESPTHASAHATRGCGDCSAASPP